MSETQSTSEEQDPDVGPRTLVVALAVLFLVLFVHVLIKC